MTETHLSIETLLDLVADSSLERPEHLNACAECRAEFERLEVATGSPVEDANSSLCWLNGLSSPQAAAFLGDFGRLLFGRAVAVVPQNNNFGELHPWFRDFLGEEPAAQLARKIVQSQL